MKRVTLFFILVISVNVLSENATIVAIVNNKSVSFYELGARKKMLMLLNNIKPNSSNDFQKQLTAAALNGLIDDVLILGQKSKLRIKVSEEQVSESIKTIEANNKLPQGYFINLFKEHVVDFQAFKTKVEADILRSKINNSFKDTVNTSKENVEQTVIDK